ncbi:hypothetical protein GBF38_022597 [Nibea albiflora]|uniref:Uncharacterized protein n=1 Tax=Nibea albiflora TaxID=240163 RepID=A0ACB7EWP3_NIBAL|nr:hypothetical protein GBF38_022597 [Nibea albiflora]
MVDHPERGCPEYPPTAGYADDCEPDQAFQGHYPDQRDGSVLPRSSQMTPGLRKQPPTGVEPAPPADDSLQQPPAGVEPTPAADDNIQLPSMIMEQTPQSESSFWQPLANNDPTSGSSGLQWSGLQQQQPCLQIHCQSL